MRHLLPVLVLSVMGSLAEQTPTARPDQDLAVASSKTKGTERDPVKPVPWGKPKA